MSLRRLIAPLLLAAGVGATVWSHPGSGIAVDDQGRVFFTAGPMIVMIEAHGAARTIIHDQTHEKFHQLHHIQRAPDGGLLTASDMGNGIWRFTPEGKLSGFYPPENDMRALAIGVGGDPFAVDRTGNLYAVNSVQDRFTQLLKISPEGRISVLAGGDWGFADGKGVAAKFGDLHSGSMVVASDGALLLTDDSARVRRVSAEGVVSTLAGGGQRGYRDGRGGDALFDGASGLALDRHGNLLVVERAGRLRTITPDGIVTTLAGAAPVSGSDGSARAAVFDEPTGIAVAPNGDLFLLEPHRLRVRRISNGRVTTVHEGLQ